MQDQTDLKYSTALRIFETTVRCISSSDARLIAQALQTLKDDIDADIRQLPHPSEQTEPQRQAVREAFEECQVRLNARLAAAP